MQITPAKFQDDLVKKTGPTGKTEKGFLGCRLKLPNQDRKYQASRKRLTTLYDVLV